MLFEISLSTLRGVFAKNKTVRNIPHVISANKTSTVNAINNLANSETNILKKTLGISIVSVYSIAKFLGTPAGYLLGSLIYGNSAKQTNNVIKGIHEDMQKLSNFIIGTKLSSNISK